MKQLNDPVPYTTYIYLTRTDLPGDEPKYALHVLLWMPENYTYTGEYDHEPPDGDPPPPPPDPEEVDHYRIILNDDTPDKEDTKEFKAIALTIDVDPPGQGKNVLQAFYSIKNEEPGNRKIVKKPKAKVAYIHADNGGAG